MGGLNRGRLSVQVGGPWRLYTHPLAHWEMLGVVRCADGWTGALARSPAGIYACLTSSPPLMAGIPSTGRPCPTASACADSFSKAPTSRTPMRDGELPDISVLGSNCLMAKEEFGTVVAT